MADPSQRVAPQLRPHVHLFSRKEFPITPRVHADEAFRTLMEAPSIVKQSAPMSWQYINAPQDGKVFLEWHPPDRDYASDGYIWIGEEQIFSQPINGYTIEMRYQSRGYRLQFENTTLHARTRFHIVSKNPAINAAHPDPFLWLVHYHATEPSYRVPVGQIPMMPQAQQALRERRMLESQGRLEELEFMLHDREKWPTINAPGGPNPQQGMYGSTPMPQTRYPQPGYPQQPNMPPNKRPRTQGPGAAPPVPGVNEIPPLDSTLEDEENTAWGDYFDHLSPREISIARYTQHHRWMEEVFSSPYATNQIVPTDLGLGLMGELKGLTDGILELPSFEFTEREDMRSAKPEEAKPFTNIKKEQLEEFNKRVEKHLEETSAEIARMKADHAQKLQSWKTVSALAQAEKKLRYVPWAGQGDAVPVFALEAASSNGHAEEKKSSETVEDIARQVESLLGIEIKPFEDAALIERGGLRERRPSAPSIDPQTNLDSIMNGFPNIEQSQQRQPQKHNIENPTGARAGTVGAPSAPIPNQNASTPRTAQAPSQGNQAPPQQQASSALTPRDVNNVDINDVNDNTAGEAMGDFDMLDDIDLSMDLGDADQHFEDAAPRQESSETPRTTVEPQQHSAIATADHAAASTDDLNAGSVFDNTFDDLVGDDDDEHGLIDFGGGMDDSAFGDAMHGMDETD